MLGSTILDGFRGCLQWCLSFWGIGLNVFCEGMLILRGYLLKYLRIIGLHISEKSRTFADAKKWLNFS